MRILTTKAEAMSFPLAIFTPQVGVQSQTFVRRHIEGLLPGGAAVVTQTVVRSQEDTWDVAGPLLRLDQLRPGLVSRGIAATARRLGWRRPDHSILAAKRFLRKHEVEVIMGEHLDDSLRWLELAQKLGLRFFGHAHGYDVSLSLRNPRWRTDYLKYNQSDGVITISRFSRDRLIGLGLKASKIHVVPYGVDVPAEPVVRPERSTIRCLAVGRMVGKKAPILVLDAFRRAAETNRALRLDFVGTGALFPAAQQFVQSFHLESCITLHGEKPNEEVQRMMREADLFIQHSITNPTDGNEEGLPVAILEAMAWALPVVSTRHAGIPEAVQEGVTGYLVDEGDSAGMAEYIVRLAQEPELRRSLGNAGWQRAKDTFSWETEKVRLLEILGLNVATRVAQPGRDEGVFAALVSTC